MTAENPFHRTEKAGLLDKVVTFVTLGKLGVDESVAYGLLNEVDGEIIQDNPIVHALKTGKPVTVSDMSKHRHILQRNLVQRKR